MSTFRVLHTPVTSAPNDLAICTANVPTPPDAPGDQDLLSRLDIPVIAQSLEGSKRRHADRRGLLECEIGRFQRQPLLGGGRILGEGALAPTEDLLTRLELGHALADRLDRPCDIRSRNTVLCSGQAEHRAHDVRHASYAMRVTDMDRGRVNSYQHLIILDHRPVDFLQY